MRTADKRGARTSIHRQVLSLALPAIVNNITVPLLGLCDTAIAGHLGDASYMGAMAVGAMMLNVVYWLCGFLRAGTSGLTAQAYGASDVRYMRSLLRQALLIALSIAIMVMILQTPLLRLFLHVISPEPAVRGLASEYFRIGIFASPAQLAVMAFSGWFIGRQNTVVPMLVSVGMNVVNIIASLILVFVCGLGFTGIALGTLAAAWLGAFAFALLARAAMRRDDAACENAAGDAVGNSGAPEPRSHGFRDFFNVGTDLFLRSFCIMAISMTMTAVGARLGDLTLAANAVIMQFFLFFSYFMDGFAFAGEALVGRAVGAHDRRLLTRSVNALMAWGVVMAVSFMLLYLVFDNDIVALLTDDSAVREAVRALHLFVVLLPPITVAAFVFDGIFIGWTRTRVLLVTTLCAAAAFFIIAFLVPGHGALPDNAVLWTAFEIYLLLRGASLLLIYLASKRTLAPFIGK